MKTSQCLLNSSIALRNVFISKSLVLESPGQLQRLLLPAIANSFRSPSSLRRLHSTRYVSLIKKGPPRAASPAPDNLLRNYDIKYPLVQIRQPDNRLSPPEETKSVLRRIDRARYDLVLIVPPKKEGKGPEYPICVVVDRRAASEAARAKEKAEKEIKKANKSVLKELEINWAIAPHDLATKMKQLKKFLSKGYRVQLRLYNPKERSKRRATPEEAKEVHKVVLQIIAEVPGTANFKPTTGAVGQELIMYLQPSTKATGTAAADGKASDETATMEVAEAAVVKEAGP
ncbi:hypothetical protein N656DRAFT_781462 [Canariomyces notabilis]|uniref:Translation initiation factor IF-3 n=1 Tax=Canariomyces notabilis TaxID=2074819 RepID=A0AAN6TAB9_9PEZI|nr:hypothetical protein N656DRAFT_781462 [Canariomyces arenarius]